MEIPLAIHREAGMVATSKRRRGATQQEATMFDLSQVSAVYSGRKGCACGCRGKYAYASAFKCDRPSYLDGDEGVNDRTVKMLATKVERLLRAGDVESVMLDTDGEWLAVDMENDRTYTVYFGARRAPAQDFVATSG